MMSPEASLSGTNFNFGSHISISKPLIRLVRLLGDVSTLAVGFGFILFTRFQPHRLRIV